MADLRNWDIETHFKDVLDGQWPLTMLVEECGTDAWSLCTVMDPSEFRWWEEEDERQRKEWENKDRKECLGALRDCFTQL